MLRSIMAIAVLLLATSTAWGLATETVGNEPFPEGSYTDWPNIMPVINDPHRVYERWVNGNESLYFKGDAEALNAALKNFAAVKTERRLVVLRPGPSRIGPFQQAQRFDFDWNLHLLGGDAKFESTLDRGINIWDPNPYLHVYVGGGVKLHDIRIPEGVEVVEIADLQTRYSAALASSDKSIRGPACSAIASLDPYNPDSMRTVAAMLDDPDDWARRQAAHALSQFTIGRDEAIEKLQAVKTEDKQLREQVARSIELLRRAPQSTDAARDEHQKALKAIHDFVVVVRPPK